MKAVIKSSLILPAVFVCGLGVALFVRANLGADPVTMLEIALAQITTLSLGQAALYFEGFIFLLFFFLNRKLIHVGSFLFWGDLILLWFLPHIALALQKAHSLRYRVN